ncbi:bifunctional 2-C-methyl-D-erythritol 4-phosphate cytidylyltransferase/2-C-methyl-D-erythritol 2,4-cyclodiphosphate synthase [Hoeflea prorocentri]|uniref:Bifunctional enzyme IspD/IspF n=1 Tax=Hoeflea prorocentri TaxID=1922333 RepID=A0A9X3UHF0_9HYPH|nr:bifunctional 2-C-methyl-D-erythritol 4-phosphate cytidylyltransferase/2-C-methyl-D-erythritol 2,4-cyclodiphosphate synthase [Hoeflea prorocentri]MCY6380737.1 bifunctional 2-C-methyl-D-erythritol 4-phosphate cytidylyltransferase/2-C-methyl-D-erythritol 2,4-cyclodiphosphate synthase [Hoeflea prorocentri]MDA5398537.1 bifunctional 2-C-methyl-D-erythritol 4-phosphate cytidylyltransferase/2-C-methyl-D-erythritol 2,4-cyclodiphosphate synthase [Hoeflea prorocentri]
MADKDTVGAVIVAAGRGERAGEPGSAPKQYRPIGGRQVLAWTIDSFKNHPDIDAIAVVIHADDHSLFDRALQNCSQPAVLTIVEGGANRQESVLKGLEALSDAGLSHVLIHDGVRPFANGPLIDRVIARLRNGSMAALPAIAVADTLKNAFHGDRVDGTVPRRGLFAAQTPQGFEFAAIFDAHQRASLNSDGEFTDDCSIAEWAKIPVDLVGGDPENVKLTTAGDIALADEKLGRKNLTNAIPDVRTGNGYDVHAHIAGNSVTLCGLEIANDQALSGHSDADVALHALTDALLATCGQGDIGDHFPPTDPQWEGAASHIFLEHAAELVRKAGGVISNVDITLICEAPKIGPHKAAMRSKLGEILSIPVERCSVKATTNERIGFIGRREGIAAIATATVVYGYDTDD